VTYRDWLAAVNRALDDRLGLCRADVPALDWRGLYSAGFTPDEAAQAALEALADAQ
jgi:hypothetical protein